MFSLRLLTRGRMRRENTIAIGLHSYFSSQFIEFIISVFNLCNGLLGPIREERIVGMIQEA